MRTIILALAVLATALAGCAGGDDSTPTPTPGGGTPTPGDATPTPGDATPTPTPGDATPTPTPGGDNTAPGIVLFSADAQTGPAPLVVNFTFKAEDPDGDALTWDLDADGDGAADGSGDIDGETVFSFTYTLAGNFTPILRVSDGAEDAFADLEIEVLPEGTEGPGQSVTGTWILGDPIVTTLLAVSGCTSDEFNGVGYYYFDVDPATWGLPYEATFGALGDAFAVWEIYWGTPDCTSDDPYETGELTTTHSGVVPDDVVNAIVLIWPALTPEFTYVAG